MKRLLISGACGRMGRMIAAQAADAGFVVVGGVDRQSDMGQPFPLYGAWEDVRVSADVLIDFSSPQALPALLQYAVQKGLPCVLGATGYTPEEYALIDQAAASIPVFQTSNMSLGVHVLKTLTAQAKRMLPGFDIEIIEKHHNKKVDAPSGTALTLYQAAAAEDSIPVHGRVGRDALRAPQEIGLHAVRGGTVAGEHEVGFYGDNESILLTHAAQSRAVFAAGALRAASFLLGKAPGRYGMDDLLGSFV